MVLVSTRAPGIKHQWPIKKLQLASILP